MCLVGQGPTRWKISALDQQCESLTPLPAFALCVTKRSLISCYCNFLLTSTTLLVCYSRPVHLFLYLFFVIVCVLHHLIMMMCAYGLCKRAGCWPIKHGSCCRLDTWVRDILVATVGSWNLDSRTVLISKGLTHAAGWRNKYEVRKGYQMRSVTLDVSWVEGSIQLLQLQLLRDQQRVLSEQQ